MLKKEWMLKRKQFFPKFNDEGKKRIKKIA